MPRQTAKASRRLGPWRPPPFLTFPGLTFPGLTFPGLTPLGLTFPGLEAKVLLVLLVLLLSTVTPLTAQSLAPGTGPRLDAPRALPSLIFESPDSLAGRRQQLEGFDPASLQPILDLVGLEQPGPPIRIYLAPEGSVEARRAPSWSIAYALGNAGMVVLIPSRVPVYPDGNLEQVLRHEIAHVLIARAAGRYGVPRWFHEGVAIVGAREWRLEDRSRLVLEAFRRDSVSMAEVEAGFSGGSQSAGRAYAVSAAFVRYLLENWGDDAIARVLAEVSEGQRFRQAFRAATGSSLSQAERAFWSDFDFWNRWVPFLTSSGALWIVVTVLALMAFRSRRLRDEEIRQQWEEEELAALRPAPGEWVM